MKKASFILLAILSICIGLYPITYFLVDRNFGLLQHKTLELLIDPLWNIGFYGHIVPAGIALLIGWIQFNKKWRAKNIHLHRTIGKVYVVSVIISSICSLYISLFATGGIASALGFTALSLVWLLSTTLAYKAIRKGNIIQHEKLMIYSYAACFAAVTLRIWLPILTPFFGNFVDAYRVVAWLCWIPNLLVAYFIIQNKNKQLS